VIPRIPCRLQLERLEDRCLLSINNIWVAAASGAWNTATNWSQGHVPIVGEIAVFDGLSSNQACTIDAGSDTCDGILINSNYTGLINQSADLTLGAGGYSQAGGAFSANSFTIHVGGDWVKSLAASFNPGTGTVDFNSSTNQNLDNAITPFNNLIHSGSGTLKLSTDSLTVAGIFLNAAGTFDPSGLNATIGGLTTIAGSSVVNSGPSDTLSLNGDLFMTGGQLSAGLGSVVLGADVTATSDANGAATIGGKLDLGGTIRTFTVNSGPGAQDLIVSAIISHGGLTKAGAGLLQFSSANTYTLGTSIAAGTLAVTADQALGPGSGGTAVAAGATLRFSGGVSYSTAEPVTLNGGTIASEIGSGTDSFAGPITFGAGGNTVAAPSGSTIILNGPINPGDFDLTVTGAGDTTINGLISGTVKATLAKQGQGTLTLTAANMYGGGTTVGSGTLAVGNDMAVCHGPLTLDNGTIILSVGAPHTLANTVNLSGLVTVAGSNNLTFNGTLNGNNGSLTQIDSGLLTLNAANTYAGGTTIDAGTLAVGNDNALGSGSLTLNTGVTIMSAGLAHSLGNSVILGGSVTVGGSNDLTLSGILSGPTGSLTQTNSGFLTLNAANTYGGGTTIDAGTLAVGNDNALGSGALIINGGSVLISADGAHTVSNAVTLSGAATVGGTNNLAVAGVISGTGSLTKIGSSLLTLTGNNNYTGTTTVNGGTLLVDGSQTASAAIINSGGTLGGNGTVGPITVSGGTLSPGTSSPGVLSSGSVQFNSGSTFAVQLAGPAAGAGFSQLVVNGTITLGPRVAALILSGSYKPQPDNRFRIIVNAGTSAVSGNFANLPEGTVFTQNGVSLQISYMGGSGHDVVLTALPRESHIAGRVASSGEWWVGLSTGSSFASSKWTSWSPSVTWVDVQTGNFTGDGHEHIVGRVLQTGEWWVAVSNGSNGFTNSHWDTWSPNVTWVDVKVGDFNGDGKMDIAGRVLQTGEWWVGLSTGSSFTTTRWAIWNPNVTWVDVNVGDFNGDGKADITGRVLQSGEWWTGLSTGSSFNTTLWDTWSPNVTWVDVKVGDFNGDGRSEITGRVLQSGEWWTGLSSGSSFHSTLWTTWSPNVTWIDVRVGDFNGDGRSDITGRVLQSGEWWTALSSGSSFNATLWTTWSPNVTWVDVQVGDFDADGKADITGRVLQSGEWWTALSSGSSFNTTLWTTWSPNVKWIDVQNGHYA
jgi:autotransporter-associated beta strand protein